MVIVGIILMTIGFLGCFVNKIPGPLVAFIGLLLVKIVGKLPISWGIIALCAALVAASMIINSKYVPQLLSKIHSFGKGGKWGTFIGSLIGLIIALKSNLVVGIIFMLGLPYVLALAFEYFNTKDSNEAIKCAGSAYTAFMVSTVIKLAVVLICFKFAINNMGGHF